MTDKLLIKTSTEEECLFLQQIFLQNGLRKKTNGVLPWNGYREKTCLAINKFTFGITYGSENWYRNEGYRLFLTMVEFINMFCQWKNGEFLIRKEKINEFWENGKCPINL